MASEQLEKLVEILQDLLDANRELLQVCGRKRKMLAAMDLDGLQEVMQTEQDLAGRIALLEERRRTVVSDLMPPDGSPRRLGKDVLLRQIIDVTPEPDRSKLAGLRHELLDVLYELRESNTTNQIVSRRSLKHFRDMLGLLTGRSADDQRYDRAGTMRREALPSTVVDHVV